MSDEPGSRDANFQRIIARYYKARYKHSEDCLGDIIKILEQKTSDGDQIQAVLSRLCMHYGECRMEVLASEDRCAALGRGGE